MERGDVAKAQQLLADLAERGFFGTVAFQMKRGEIVLIRQESTTVPSELPLRPTDNRNGRTDRDRKF